MAEPSPSRMLLGRAGDWGRAPSAHNTQPWAVTTAGPCAVAVGWHADRVLRVGDPTGRDLMLSLGCAVEALVVTAGDLGYAVHVAWDVDRSNRRAAVLDLVQDRTPPLRSFTVADLHERRTPRCAYAEPGPGEAGLRELARQAGLGPDLGLTALDGEVAERALVVADRWTFEGEATAELRHWLRLDPSHPRYHKDGLTDVALGLTSWERRGLAIALSRPVLGVLRATRLTRVLARTATARPLGTVVALTGPPQPGDELLAEAGRALLRVWLAGGRRGWAAHPLSQLLDCRDSADVVQSQVSATRQAYAVWRVGVPVRTAARSARLTDDR